MPTWPTLQHEERAAAYERALTEKLSVQGRDALGTTCSRTAATAPSSHDGCPPTSSTCAARTRLARQPCARDHDGALDRLGHGAALRCRPARRCWWSAAATTRPRSRAVARAAGAAPRDARTRGRGLARYRPKCQRPGHRGALRLLPRALHLQAARCLAGCASGMPSPAYYQWMRSRPRGRRAPRAAAGDAAAAPTGNCPASTADLMAVHLRAQGLARLRGHEKPLRSDWLDALAGAGKGGAGRAAALDLPRPDAPRHRAGAGAGDGRAGRRHRGPARRRHAAAAAGEVGARRARGARHRAARPAQARPTRCRRPRAAARELHRLAAAPARRRRSQGPKLAMSANAPRSGPWPALRATGRADRGRRLGRQPARRGARGSRTSCATRERIGPLAEVSTEAAWAGLPALQRRAAAP